MPHRPPVKRRDSVLQLNNGFYVDPYYQPKQFYNDDAASSDVIDDLHCLEHICPDVELDSELYKRVLVLYTGGTIGMHTVDGGK